MTDVQVAYQDAQRVLVSSAFHYGPEVWESVKPDALDEPLSMIAAALAAIQHRGVQVTPGALHTECLARGHGSYLDRWMTAPVAPQDAVAMWVDAKGKVDAEAALTRTRQMLDAGADHWPVLDELVERLGSIPRPLRDDGSVGSTFDEVMAMREIEHPWVLPNLLAEGDRCVITGKEGFGKSTLIYQLALGAAYGVNPLNPSETFDPQRVVVLDVENWHETQVRQQYATLSSVYRRYAPVGLTPDITLLHQRNINLISPGERDRFLSAVDRLQPNLLVMGAGYKLTDVDDYRTMALTIQRTADKARALAKCAVLIETHAGHGNAEDRNGWRPDGSSYWLRWPEFGLGLAPYPTTDKSRLLEVHRWRGDRVEGRHWPAAFRGGGKLPWSGMDDEEWEHLKSGASDRTVEDRRYGD